MQPDSQLNRRLLEFLARAGRNTEDREAWVHALVDMRESFERIYNELLPAALRTEERESAIDVLGDIREELRHIAYHLDDVSLR